MLSWRKTVVDDIAYQDDAYVYALVRNGRLLYIGKSYKTKVSNEVRANMASFGISKRNLVVYLGDFQTDDFRGRMDRLVHHVEALLNTTTSRSTTTTTRTDRRARPVWRCQTGTAGTYREQVNAEGKEDRSPRLMAAAGRGAAEQGTWSNGGYVE